jgi:hypothetical protein
VSRIQETKRAYDKLVELLDQEIRRRSGSTKDLERFRETLNVAFYLLGWSQFEYLVCKEAEERVEDNARSHTVDGLAWRYMKENVKGIPVRRRLDLIFHGNHKVIALLNREYTVRNEAAHDYKRLPPEAKDLSLWLDGLEHLVSKF